MKQIKWILMLCIAGTVFVRADVLSVLPYSATLDYDSNSIKSGKDKGYISGVYISKGNLSYLLEVDYASTMISYKDPAKEDLKQQDMTITYGTYFVDYMYKFGLHNIDTTDIDLGNANVFIGEYETYKWRGYDKYSYGLEVYDLSFENNVNIIQLSPYMSLSKSLSLDMRNNITFKVNYEDTPNFKKKSYHSFEIEDTLYYKKVFGTIKYFTGQMKAGVIDKGHTVYNSLDTLEQSYTFKVGYYITPSLNLVGSYTTSRVSENLLTSKATNISSSLSVSYSF